MNIGSLEIFVMSIVLIVGIIGNVVNQFRQSSKKTRLKWSVSLYGVLAIIFISGILTPPDVFSNFIISTPAIILYFIILGFTLFKKQDKIT